MKEKRCIRKELNKYIFPSIFAMIGISCYILADTFFISVAAGAEGITALNLALPVYSLMFAFGSMIGVGSATRYSLDKASGKADCEGFFWNSIICSMIFSIPFIITGLFGTDRLLVLLGADEMILETGCSYLRIALMFAPAFMLNYTMTAFARNDNAPKIAMAATLGSSMFNILFDYVFMFPMKMGMNGAALATGISPIVSMIICGIHYFSRKNTIKLIVKMPDIKKLAAACPLGVPGFIGEISSGVTTMCFNFVLLRLAGNIGVAAYGVIANVSLVGIAVFNGISQGLQPMASESSGKGDRECGKIVLSHSLLTGIIVSLVFVAVCNVAAEGIVRIFNSESSAEMASYAVTGMRLYSLGFPFAVVNITAAGFFGAVGKARECALISILRGVGAIILFVMILPLFIGVNGVWLAFPVAEAFTLITVLAVLLRRARD